MKWTNDKPSIEGWYFWRPNSKSTDSLHWYVLYVEDDLLPRSSGQWAGPIPEPEELE